MADQQPSSTSAQRPGEDPTFKRHGPEPPENDSGPSPSIDDTNREQGNADGPGASAEPDTSRS